MADETEEQNVVVIGKRLGYQASTGGAWGTLGPEMWVSTRNWQAGVGGEPVVQTTEIVKETGPQVFKFEDFSFVVEISAAEWENMTAPQKQAIVYVLKHYHEFTHAGCGLAAYSRSRRVRYRNSSRRGCPSF